MPRSHPELFDPQRSRDYAAVLKPLRHDEPIFYFDEVKHPSWIITRHSDVLTLLRDKRLVVPSVATRITAFPSHQKDQLEPMQAFIRANLGKTRERRKELRKATKAFFRPGSVRQLRERVRGIVERLHSAVDEKQPVDIISAYSYPMPAIVLADLLGVPEEDRENFIGWSESLIRFHRSYEFEQLLDAQAGVVKMLDYCSNHIVERPRNASQGDMADMFGQLHSDGRFELAELAASCATFLMAGHENTSHLIGNIFNTLFANPAMLAQLRGDLGLIRNTIDESLRYNGVVPFVTREVSEAFEYAGHRFEQGHLISLSLFSANRDEAMFEAADEFDIHNQRARLHLGFGHGENQCRGSHLALMETEVLLRFLFEHYPNMTPVEGGMQTSCQPMLRRYITRFEVRLEG